MKFIFCLLFVFGSVALVSAQSASDGSNIKRNKDYFLQQVTPGEDTLQAVINMFFRKRKEASTGLIVGFASYPVIIVAATGIALGSAMTQGKDPEKRVQNLVVGYTVVFYGITLPSTFRLVKYNRNRLQQIINEYPDHRTIPDAYRNNLRNKDFN